MKKYTILAMLCLSLVGYGQSTRLYKKLKDVIPVTKTDEANKLVQVTMPEAIVKPHSKTSKPRKIFLTDLSDRGQAAYIKGYGTTIGSGQGEVLHKLLSKPLKEVIKKKQSVHEDYTFYDLHLEFDVRNVHSPIDANDGRIGQLQLSLELDNTTDLEFVAFKNLNTRYEIVDFGDIEVSRTRNFSLSAGLELGSTGATELNNTTTGETSSSDASATRGISGTFGSTKTINETISQKKRVIAQMGTMSDDGFSILQQGAPGKDLEGKVVVDAVVQVKQAITNSFFCFSKLYDDRGNPTAQVGVKIFHYYGSLPQLDSIDAITATLKYNFEYRNILNKQGTKTEHQSDDKIAIHILNNGELVQSEKVLLNKKDFTNTTTYYTINEKPSNRLFIDYYGHKMELKLKTIDEAAEFLLWLKRTSSLKVEDQALYFGKNENSAVALTTSQLNKLEPFRNQLKMKNE